MAQKTLLPKRGRSFWKSNKKFIKAAVAGAAIFIVACGVLFLYFHFTTKTIIADRNKNLVSIPAAWVLQYFGTTNINDPKVEGIAGDPDHDGLINYQEYKLGSNPKVADTDADGISDGYEVTMGSDPLKSDNLDRGVKTQAPVINASQALKNVTDELVSQGFMEQAEADKAFGFDRPLVIPDVPDSQIRIVPSTPQNRQNYQDRISEILLDYNNGKIATEFSMIFSATDPTQVAPVKDEVGKLLAGLRALPVPDDQISKHKTYLVFFGAMLKSVESQEQYLKNPDDINPWSEIIYQSQIMSLTGGGEEATIE